MQFVPRTNGQRILSCAADGQIRLSDVERHSMGVVQTASPWLGKQWWLEATEGTRDVSHGTPLDDDDDLDLCCEWARRQEGQVRL